MRSLLNALLFFPSRTITRTPAQAGLDHRELWFDSGDGERLHGWWIARRAPARGHVLLMHGNGGNIGDRLALAEVLTAVGFDVLLFDWRGFGNSSGSPGEHGTYRDARAARVCLLRQPGVDPARVLYLGESLGSAVAVELALAHPPAALVLLSAFTSVRDLARLHYRLIPKALVPDAYPSLRRIAGVHAPLLVLHGDDDMTVPVEHGRALLHAAPGRKRLFIVPGVGHNDIVSLAGPQLAGEMASWAASLQPATWSNSEG
ncbi:MAG: uncharacterized protein QOJ89_3701 [bacterium]